MNFPGNYPEIDTLWILENIMKFNKEDLIIHKEQHRHMILMKQRILKLKTIYENIKRK